MQHLKRSDLQCFIWKQCMKQNMVIPKLKACGWYMKGGEKFFQFGMLENNYHQVLLREILDDCDTDDDDDDNIPTKKSSKVCYIS